MQYDDGTSHTYTTLERPNLHFDATGQLTHINLAVDLVTGDEGCANRTKHAHNGHTYVHTEPNVHRVRRPAPARPRKMHMCCSHHWLSAPCSATRTSFV